MLSKESLAVFEWSYNNSTTQELIHSASLLPISRFDKDLPEGKVLDIGYQHGGLVLYYASRGREVHAFDKEQHHEIRLRERIANEPYRDKISYSLGTLPDDPLPDDKFAIISICSVLHFFEFPTVQSIISRLSDILIPGGWIITRNHHIDHLYRHNPRIFGPDGNYKHFFTPEDFDTLLPKNEFDEKYVSIERKHRTKKDIEACDFHFNFVGQDTPEQRQRLKDAFIDIPYHTDIFTVHQKSFV